MRKPTESCNCIAGEWERLKDECGTDHLATVCPRCGTKYVFDLDNEGRPVNAVALPSEGAVCKPTHII
jgi:hypothetical protein